MNKYIVDTGDDNVRLTINFKNDGGGFQISQVLSKLAAQDKWTIKEIKEGATSIDDLSFKVNKVNIKMEFIE